MKCKIRNSHKFIVAIVLGGVISYQEGLLMGLVMFVMIYLFMMLLDWAINFEFKRKVMARFGGSEK